MADLTIGKQPVDGKRDEILGGNRNSRLGRNVLSMIRL